ncbi:MAG: hypothetical protein BWZ02_02642 [Lentisphaerae bacterium ADurb.BinA184]|nr:MAG: hypothetical protein BWZ02_02642 [Lentisphaerae bacterium ADurb.BinA184]
MRSLSALTSLTPHARHASLSGRIALTVACLLLAATGLRAAQIAINFDHYVAGADVNDLANGGYYWDTITLTTTEMGSGSSIRPLTDVSGAASPFDMQSVHSIRLASIGEGVSTPFVLDGVRLPRGVSSYGYGGIDESVGTALNQWKFRVPVSSGLNSWSFTLFAGDTRNGGLSPIAANIGGVFSWAATVGTFTGGLTTHFDGPSANPNNQLVNWFRSGRLTGITPAIENIGGVDYYVATLQFADMGRLISTQVDYGSLHALVFDAVHIPEPAAATLLGLAALAFAAGRRRRGGR